MTVISERGHDLSGTTAQRPTNAEPGTTYWNTTLEALEACNSAGVMKPISGKTGLASVTAAGSDQSGAAALTSGATNLVTAADGTKGVLLPVIVTGDVIRVYNSSTSNLKVYPTSTNTIGGGTASTAVTVLPMATVVFVATSSTNWSVAGSVVVSSAQGVAASLIGGTSTTSGNAGGAAVVTGGTPGATGVGGAVTITSGPGGSTSGAAGAITITGGSATSANGSNITITAGSGAGGTNAGGSVNLVPGAAVSTGLPGEIQVNSDSQLFFVSESLTATDATRTVMVCTRACRLKSVSVVWTTGSSSGTLQLEKCTGTTAPGSGTALLTGTVSLAGTGNTVASGTLISTVASLTFAAGNRLGIVIAGTMTNLAGARITIGMTPA